jgi:PAS domain S-box-containing protein
MDATFKIKETFTNLNKNALVNILLSLFLSFIVALVIHSSFIKQLDIYYMILEMICIFITLSLFVSIWYSSKYNISILSFGLLISAIFEAFRCYYLLKSNLNIYYSINLSNKFWIMSRFTQAVFMLFYAKNLKIIINKWIGLIIFAFLTASITYFSIFSSEYLLVIFTYNGIKALEIFFKYAIIILFFLTAYNIKNKNKKFANTKHIHIYVYNCIVLAIVSEICFIYYRNDSSIIYSMGYTLKTISYYFLFKAIFVNTFIFSFSKLKKEHKILEEAVYEVNSITQTLSDILEALPFAVFTYNDEGRIKYINSKFEEIFNCNRINLYNLTTFELSKIFKNINTEEKTLWDIVSQSEGNEIKMFRTYKLQNGEYKKVAITSRKIKGGVIALIKEAKEEQALSNLNLQTETILNSVSNSVLMIDKDKKVVLCNRAFEELAEIKKEDIIGIDIDKLSEMIHYEGGKLIKDALQGQCIDHDKFKEISLTTLDGDVKEISIYTGNIKNVEGEIIGAISINTDITEIKKEQFKIRQQEKLALLGQLGAGIVHETRNFLTNIKGRCQIIEAISKDESIKKYASKINNDVDEVNSIISEFLFLSKPRETQMQEVSMVDIFQSIKNLVETSSLVKGVNVNVLLSEEERYLLCDEVQIKQVILNICKNAVDAMIDKENAVLNIETGYDEDKNEMFIKISDNGKGMSEEEIKKLGTIFYTTKNNGTGLGLNVCYQIINEHNGRIEVESKPMKGSTFKIILPCIEDIYEDEDIENSTLIK